MKIKEIEIVKKYIVKKYVCDGCGLEISCDTDEGECFLPNYWYEFTARHHHWGNGSIESCKAYHCCCPECYLDCLRKAVRDYSEFSPVEINNMPINFVRKFIKYIDKIHP